MAMTYQNFASLGVNLNRQKYGPLDISNVFTSENDLKYYLTKGAHTEGVSKYWYENADKKVVPYPYEGQVLATVIDGVVSVYALSLDAEGNFQTQEIGAKVEVDGTTIVKDANGKLSIVAPVNPDSSKTYNFSYANGVYSWVEVDTATAAGQAQAIAGLTDRTVALETAINGKAESEEGAGDAVVGLIDKVAALEAVDNATQAELDTYKTEVTTAIGQALQAAKDYADAQDADTVYDDTELSNRVKAIEDDYLKTEDKYNDTELVNRISSAEESITTLTNVVGDAESGIVKALADEIARAEAAESDLNDKIDAIDFVDSTELATALEPYATTQYVDEQIDAVEDAISKLNHFTTKIVSSTDEVTETGVLYLIKDEAVTGIDKYNEYILVDGAAVLIGDTTTDLSNYYNKSEIDNKVSTIEGSISDEVAARGALAEEVAALKAIDNATQAELEAYKLEVTSAISTAKQEAINDADGKLANKLDTSVFTEFQETNTTAIATAKQEAINAAGQAVDAKGYAVATEVANTYATKDALAEAVEEFENDLVGYYTKSESDALLANKADTSSVYTKTEIDNKIGTPGKPEVKDEEGNVVTEGVTGTGIFASAYSRAEVDDLLDKVSGGSSETAASVKRQLDTYISTNDNRVTNIEGVNAAQDTAIAAAQLKAEQGVADAAAVATNLVTANLAIAENTRQIGVVDDKIDTINETLTGKITALEGKDVTIESNITALQTTVSGHTTTITEHGTKLATLEDKDTELAALIQGNTDKFANYSTTEQMNAAITKAITDADLDNYATVASVEAIYKAGVDGASATGILADEIARATAAEQANAKSITDLIGQDTGKTIRVIAGEETAKIVAGADTKYDTLKEIADFIMNDETGAAAMSNDIATLKTTVGDAESGLVKAIADNAAAIEAIVQPQASAEVTVATDGTLGLGKVTTDKLVQGENTLVLDGGSAAN